MHHGAGSAQRSLADPERNDRETVDCEFDQWSGVLHDLNVRPRRQDRANGPTEPLGDRATDDHGYIRHLVILTVRVNYSY